MAVPSSGTLTMLGIARERKYSNYVSTGIIPYPILMTDLINGGGLNNFPLLNTNCFPRPNTSTPHSMNEWYGYDQDCPPPSSCEEITLRYLSRYKNPADACSAFSVAIFTENAVKWFTEPIYVSECEEQKYAQAGAYSDGTTWAEWDGMGSWGKQGICTM